MLGGDVWGMHELMASLNVKTIPVEILSVGKMGWQAHSQE